MPRLERYAMLAALEALGSDTAGPGDRAGLSIVVNPTICHLPTPGWV
jgi:hypothetical protein